MRSLLLSTLILAMSAPALAVPLEFSHQGRLFDGGGAPITAPTDVTFRIYDAPSGGSHLWEEVHSGLAFDNGYYNAPLGASTSLDSSAFDGDTMYLAIQVGTGAELTPRLPMVSVPYAIRAGDADSADMAQGLATGLSIDANELRINGTTVIDSSGQVDAGALGSSSDTLAELGCSTDQIAEHNGTDWACVTHVHDASDITSGSFDVAFLPVGTGSNQVAAGDHSHDAASVGALAVGTTAADIGGLASTTTAADIGGVMAGDALTLGDSSATCDSSTTSLHGTMRYSSDSFQGCTPQGWVSLRIVNPFSASGGTVADVGGWRVHTFTSSGTFDVGAYPGDVEVLVVAGGGGGGGRSGGGGGAGGLIYDSAFTLAASQSITVTVGGGGAGGPGTGTAGADGADSVFGSLTAIGGGGGGADTNGGVGRAGGSGGGGRYGNNGGAGTSGQGNDGGFGNNNPYAGGGGGGAGGVGVDGTAGGEIGDGGPGLVFDISGASACYAGGGGGGSHNPANGRGFATSVDGLPCGGGIGGAPGGNNSGAAGVANTGGGGGAGSTDSSNGGSGGNGGSGIVIVRYPI